MLRFLFIAFLVLFLGCSTFIQPPELIVLPEDQMGGLAAYYDRTYNRIYLGPWSTEKHLQHELNHWYGLRSEPPRMWYEVYK